MIHPDFFILYVDSPSASETFYANLLGEQAIESSPTFAMFVLKNGLRLGLWSKHTVEPTTVTSGGGAELVFSVESVPKVNELYASWQEIGLSMAQKPEHMEFGYTFVALDPDNHRLRVYSRNNQQPAVAHI